MNYLSENLGISADGLISILGPQGIAKKRQPRKAAVLRKSKYIVFPGIEIGLAYSREKAVRSADSYIFITGLQSKSGEGASNDATAVIPSPVVPTGPIDSTVDDASAADNDKASGVEEVERVDSGLPLIGKCTRFTGASPD